MFYLLGLLFIPWLRCYDSFVSSVMHRQTWVNLDTLFFLKQKSRCSLGPQISDPLLP